MRIPKQLLHLGAALALAATLPANAQDFPDKLPQTAWFRQFQQELRAAWVAPATATSGPIKFIVGNDRHQAGAAFKTGVAWLALACSAAECRLVPANLRVKAQRGGQQLHFEAADAAGTRVIAWFAVKQAPSWLVPGAIPTYYSGKGRPKGTGKGTEEALISLPDGNTAILMPILLASPDPSAPLPPALLLLRVGERRQLLLGQLGLCSHRFRSEDYLLWVGDLDKDGKPDFLVSFVDGDGPIHLYLSSAAKPQQQVGLAGVYNPPPSGTACDANSEGDQEP